MMLSMPLIKSTLHIKSKLHCHCYSLSLSQGALQVAKGSKRELTSFITTIYGKGLSRG